MRAWTGAGLLAGALVVAQPGAALAQSGARPSEVVLVETGFTATDSTVVVRDLASGREHVVATLPHAAGYGAEGSVSPDGRWLAVAVLATGNHVWRHAQVWLVDLATPGVQPRRLLDEAMLQAPVWGPSGEVIATRSAGEHEASATDSRGGRLTELDVEVVAVALASGASASPDVVYRERCQWLSLVGTDARGEVLMDREAFTGHALLALRPGASAPRLVANLGGPVPEWLRMAPGARAVTYAQAADAANGGTWAVRETTIDGATRELLREANDHACPVPFAGGGVAYGSADGHAVVALDPATRASRELARDAGAERFVVRRASDDGRTLAYDVFGPGGTRTFVADARGALPAVQVGDGQRWREVMGFRGAR